MNLEHASDSVIKLDRMRYTKDSASANLILLAIVLDALYFVRLFQQDVSTYYYSWQIGAAVIYNLLFLLLAFLCSENVKNRKVNMIPLQVFLCVMQFVRITQIPAKAKDATILIGDVATDVMSTGTYYFLVAMLIASGICLALATVNSLLNYKKLSDYMKTLETQSA